MKTYVALDPGGTTGICIYKQPESTDRDVVDEVWWRGSLEGQHHLNLYELLRINKPDAVIWERFLYQRRELDRGVSLVLDSREYIGVAKLYCLAHAIRGYEQTPSQAKNLWSDEKLKRLGLWSSSPHERDATRHMLYFLTVTLQDQQWVVKARDPRTLPPQARA